MLFLKVMFSPAILINLNTFFLCLMKLKYFLIKFNFQVI